jgi:isopentenyl diphosphate isomerase/L-lactate dehydrogenase-like FMN-dependent dehydrogenase
MAFNKWQIVPRMMGDVSNRSIETELFGNKLPTPVLLGPVGVLSIAHPEAEFAVARAAKALQVPQVVSTVSSKPIEEIGAIHGVIHTGFNCIGGVTMILQEAS